MAGENRTAGISGFSAQEQHDPAIKGEKTLVELAEDFDLHRNQIKQWRNQFLEGATGVFGETPKGDPVPKVNVKTLHAKIGELTLENDFLSGSLGKAGLLPSAKR